MMRWSTWGTNDGVIRVGSQHRMCTFKLFHWLRTVDRLMPEWLWEATMMICSCHNLLHFWLIERTTFGQCKETRGKINKSPLKWVRISLGILNVNSNRLATVQLNKICYNPRLHNLRHVCWQTNSYGKWKWSFRWKITGTNFGW